MDLDLAVVAIAQRGGCTAQFLDTGERVEAAYSEGIRRHGVQILADDVVALDQDTIPPSVVFRWALDRVVRIEEGRVYTQRGRGGQTPALAAGLEVRLSPGDRVYVAFGEIHSTGAPALLDQPARLRAAFPEIKAMLRRMEGERQAKPTSKPRAGSGTRKVSYLSAETAAGRAAMREVMAHSYTAEMVASSPSWTRVRVVDGVPVSFVVVDPDRQLAFSGGEVRCAFVNDVATREDRRREGHFRALMEHVFASLCDAGIPLVLLHGRYPLYRPLGFDVFTHHCGVFVSPAQVERTLGLEGVENGQRILTVEEHPSFPQDLLIASGVEVEPSQPASQQVPLALRALRAAAAMARERGKERILFEHPAPDARYSIHASLETHLAAQARTCGGQVIVQGADPESGSIPDADWIKVLDAPALVRQVLDVLGPAQASLPEGEVCLDTDAGAVTLACRGGKITAHAGRRGVETAVWPSGALAQLVTGYRPAALLSALHQTPLSSPALALLDALFPRRWRLSRNESWVYTS
jgi:hypothetical protein